MTLIALGMACLGAMTEQIDSVTLVRSAPVEQETPVSPADTGGVGAEAVARPSPAMPPVSGAVAADPTTAAERFNGGIDKLVAAGERVLEIPLFMILGVIGAVCFIVALALRRYLGEEGHNRVTRGLLATEVVLAALAVIFVLDRKITRLQTAVAELRQKTSADAATLLDTVSKLESKRRSFLCDLEEVQKTLTRQWGEVSLRPSICDEATDFVQLRVKRPLVKAYVAVIDLKNPALQIQLGVSLDKKKLTSEFARESECTVAINGEAGNSPSARSGLGEWRGYLVRQGEVLLQESPKFPAPFLSFDRQNLARFIPGGCANRALPTNAYNAIWGRWDVLRDGEVLKGGSGNRQPRTAMAINREGTMLFLLVADGRQHSYSAGLTREGVGQCLKAFGAQDGMLCDEGGSSCIFLAQFGGIANIPADNYGQERPTYTHFGIRMRAAK